MKQNKKYKPFIILIIFISFGYLIYQNGFPFLLGSKDERFFYKKLKEFQISGQESIALKELTNFEWDEACSQSTYDPKHEDSYAEFYLNGKFVRKIKARALKINEKENYYSFGHYIGKKDVIKPTIEKKIISCGTLESYRDSKMQISLKDYGDKNYYILFLY